MTGRRTLQIVIMLRDSDGPGEPVTVAGKSGRPLERIDRWESVCFGLSVPLWVAAWGIKWRFSVRDGRDWRL